MVNKVHAAVVNGVEGGIGAVALCRREFLLHLFSVSVQLDLHQDELCEFFLNVQGEVVVAPADHVWSLGGLGSQFAISARQDDLHKVGIMQRAVDIRIEKLDEIVAISLRYIACQPVVSDEV